jgi:hypothetical protein
VEDWVMQVGVFVVQINYKTPPSATPTKGSRNYSILIGCTGMGKCMEWWMNINGIVDEKFRGMSKKFGTGIKICNSKENF